MTATTLTIIPAQRAADDAPEGAGWPEPDTIVLLNREIRPGADISALSRFAEDAWYLTPAIFEEHARSLRLNFALAAGAWRLDAKYYYWQLINYADHPGGRSSPHTIKQSFKHLRPFLQWLAARGVATQFSQVTPAMLDSYLDWVANSDAPMESKARRLQEVRRLWSYRSVLPPRMRLPAAEPWDGEGITDLLNIPAARSTNRTPRLGEQSMQTLLAWAIRFVEDFADDIIAAVYEHRTLLARTRKRRTGRNGTRSAPGEIRLKMEVYLDRLRSNGETLPGAVHEDQVEIDWEHLARIFDCHQAIKKTSTGRLIRESGLPVAAGALLDAPVSGALEGQPWLRTRITFQQAPILAQQLSTACLVIISYLSGARVGEVLSLRRGCLEHDKVTGLWLMRGRYWKGAKDVQGNKIPEGKLREIPWVVVDVVATAVKALERLHGHDLLFPASLVVETSRARDGKARTGSEAGVDLNAFVAWVNEYCRQNRRSDVIPPDGRLNLSRFRRTLAWFIRSRPRGLVAASLQYGHVETVITQGYAGTYESGFPDDYAFEDWLFRQEILAEDAQRLADGEHISGPAAEGYRQRVRAATTEFAGLVVTTATRARALLADPRLQVFHGEGMTCVLNPATAACQLRTTVGDPESTPDTDDCRPKCPNLARTDRDIEHNLAKITELEEVVADPLAPPIRHQREQHELDRLRTIVRTHQTSKEPDTT